MTRGRIPVCRCCGALAASTLCASCGDFHARRPAAVQAAIVALWGTTGLTQWQTELRARRLGARRTTRPGRKAS